MLLGSSSMNTRSIALPLILAVSALAGCASPTTGDHGTSEDELRSNTILTNYGIAMGIVATGAKAAALYDTIESSLEAKLLTEDKVLAGLTLLDVELAKEGDEDANEPFGIVCEKIDPGDSAADVCSVYAVVAMKDQGEANRVTLGGSLARAVASALPRTSPRGLVGSTTYGAGPVSCKSVPGTGVTCTVDGSVVTTSLKDLAGDEGLSTEDAKALVQAFFGSDDAPSSQGSSASLRATYGMAMGTIATGAAAATLYDSIDSSINGKPLDEDTVLAGLTRLDVELASDLDEDASQGFGVLCQRPDPTERANTTCSVYAVVEMKAQAAGRVTLSGRLAREVAIALPRKSPEGIVGATTYGAGPVTCKAVPGPTGTTCTIDASVTVTSFKTLSAKNGSLTSAEADARIRAFFPKS